MNFKRDIIYLLVIILLIGLCGQFYFSYRYKPENETKIFYNQERELNKEIVQVIRSADQFVYFAVYTFTRHDIKDALLSAKYRGLDVVGIADREQYQRIEEQRKIVDELREKGIPVYEQDHSAIMHLKTVVTEKAYASGSFNWTSAATNLNDEVLEVGTNEKVRKQYERVLQELFSRYGK